jgi:hypothetical protein
MQKQMKFLGVTIMLIAGLMLSGTALAEDEYPSEVTLFKNVNIFDGVSDKLKTGRDVLVVKNKIHKIAKDIPAEGGYEVEMTSSGEKKVTVLSDFTHSTYTISVKEGDDKTRNEGSQGQCHRWRWTDLDAGAHRRPWPPADERQQYRGHREQSDLGRSGHSVNGQCRKRPDVRFHLMA